MQLPQKQLTSEGVNLILAEDKDAAPWYTIPPRSIVSLEHPFIVKNIEKGIETLGGPSKLRRLVQDESSTSEACLYLHPRDRLSKPIPSLNVQTNNIVLLLTVPKRVRRKRKGATDSPTNQGKSSKHGEENASAQLPVAPSKDAEYLLRSLKDNVNRHSIRLVGMADHTHRFRTMPDFAYSAGDGPFMKKMRESILPFEYEKLKGFKFDKTKGLVRDTELFPPPSLTHFSMPFNYSYRQNPSVKQAIDISGNVTTVNTQIGRRIQTQLITFDVASIPTQPTEDVPPISSLDSTVQRFVKQVRDMLDERPVWTRRALSNRIAVPEWNNIGKFVYQYVGYTFRSGPWREALIKFGVDPRTDPRYRIYQTMTFRLDRMEPVVKASVTRNRQSRRGGARVRNKDFDRQSHIFDGVNLNPDGKVWQHLYFPPQTCETNATFWRKVRKDGWYHNGTWSKVKIIMKELIARIIDGNESTPDCDLAKLARLPDIVNEASKPLAFITEGEATAKEVELASAIRQQAFQSTKGGSWHLRDAGEFGVEGAGQDGNVDDRVAHSIDELSRVGLPVEDDEVSDMSDSTDQEDIDEEGDDLEGEE